MKFVVNVDQDKMESFIQWAWGWYQFDAPMWEDDDFRTVAEMTWQIQDQLKRAEK